MRVVVTGGGRGLGLCLAREMDARGHAVVVASRSSPDGWMGNIRVVRCDVSDPDSVLKMARAAAESMGGVDAWVNNAGAGMRGADDLGASDEGWMGAAGAVVGANVAGVLHGTHCAARVGARHVFNVYGAGHDGRTAHCAGHGVYAASKSFVAFYTRVLARHEPRVRAHGIVPGLMRTDMLAETCEGLPAFNRAVLEALSVSPESVAATAARVMTRIVERDEPPREVDCYGPNLARKAWRWARRARRARR